MITKEATKRSVNQARSLVGLRQGRFQMLRGRWSISLVEVSYLGRQRWAEFVMGENEWSNRSGCGLGLRSSAWKGRAESEIRNALEMNEGRTNGQIRSRLIFPEV